MRRLSFLYGVNGMKRIMPHCATSLDNPHAASLPGSKREYTIQPRIEERWLRACRVSCVVPRWPSVRFSAWCTTSGSVCNFRLSNTVLRDNCQRRYVMRHVLRRRTHAHVVGFCIAPTFLATLLLLSASEIRLPTSAQAAPSAFTPYPVHNVPLSA